MKHSPLLGLALLTMLTVACGGDEADEVAETATGGSSGTGGANAGSAGAGAGGGKGGGAGKAGAGLGGGGGSGGAGAAGAGGGAPVVTVTFAPSTADMLNPERGFYDGVDLVTLDDASYVRKAGSTLAYAGVHLDAYRDAALPTTLLDALDKGFAAVRAGRIKVVLRFVYNDGFDPDASLSRIQGHLGQLAPVLAKNADVIAVMQAGFIGAWGEWHSSTNKLTNPADEKAVLEAILKALPASRMTQIRTPMAKEGAYGLGPIGEADAFSGSSRARIGHHNDCFLADATDMGTYDTPVQTWKDYVAAEGRFVPVGGETCQPSTFAACAGALSAMETLHWSFLNSLYHPDVIAGWKPPKGDCLPAIRQRLGYRIALTSAKLPKTVAPGGLLPLEVTLANTGFAAPFNPRKVHVVLRQGATRLVAALGKVDPRRWEGGKSATFATTLRVPASLAKGSYEVALWLPDDAASLRDVPEYAVQLANAGTWDAATGDNVLLPDLAVDPAAPGPVDSLASAFAEQP